MTEREFDTFIAALRRVMESCGQDPSALEILPDLSSARLPMPAGQWFIIIRERLDTGDGPALEIAETAYAVYREDMEQLG